MAEEVKTTPKTTEVKNDTKTEQKPVNTQSVRDGVQDDPEPDMKSELLVFAEENEKFMTQGTKQKLDTLLARIGSEDNYGMIFEDKSEFGLQLMVLPGSYPKYDDAGNPVLNDKGKQEYESNIFLPGSMLIKSKGDGAKIRLEVRQAVALRNYLNKFFKDHEAYVHYMASLDQDIAMRRAQVDVFSMGEE